MEFPELYKKSSTNNISIDLRISNSNGPSMYTFSMPINKTGYQTPTVGEGQGIVAPRLLISLVFGV